MVGKRAGGMGSESFIVLPVGQKKDGPPCRYGRSFSDREVVCRQLLAYELISVTPLEIRE
ncbi:MAG: hypothetical protein WCQ66_01140 [Sphaerochaetaceae bacterium]